MLCFMRSLELHVIETASDVDDAVTAGVLLPENLVETECSDCSEGVGYSGIEEFAPFSVVIDENNRDWVLCTECASPVIDGGWRQATHMPETYSKGNLYEPDEDIDFF
jgi:hypothetical protein